MRCLNLAGNEFIEIVTEIECIHKRKLAHMSLFLDVTALYTR